MLGPGVAYNCLDRHLISDTLDMILYLVVVRIRAPNASVDEYLQIIAVNEHACFAIGPWNSNSSACYATNQSCKKVHK